MTNTEMMLKLTSILNIGLDADVIDCGHRLMAYNAQDKLVADIAIYFPQRFCFFHYCYGLYGNSNGNDAIAKMKDAFESIMAMAGFEFAYKGGNPILFNEVEQPGYRSFKLPTDGEIKRLSAFVTDYLAKRFPAAEIDEMVIYAGMGWFMASNGNDSLGVRDIDINVFFKSGGPKSLAWITKLSFEYDGLNRTVDLYWNTLKQNQGWKDYLFEKVRTAKKGRWLTIPDRPWVSILGGQRVVVWPGR